MKILLFMKISAKHIGLTMLFSVWCALATAQVSANQCEYWIDYAFDSRTHLAITDGKWEQQLDVGSLLPGLHTIGIRIGTSDGRWSPALMKNILVPQPSSTEENVLKAYEYWIDHQFAQKVSGTIASSGIIDLNIDFSTLSPGLHNIAFRVLDANGHPSSILVKNFLVPQPSSTEENVLKTYEYWIDHQFDKKVSGTIASSGIIDLNIDFSTLSPGLHNIAFRVLDANGHPSSILVKNFLVPQPSSTEDNGLVSYRYWIDRDETNAVEGTVSEGGIVEFEYDASGLAAGLHTISYQVIDKLGKWSPALVSYFVKPIVEQAVENKLIAYDYWFNDAPRTRVELDPQQSIDITDAVITIPQSALQSIPADYTFDAANKTIGCVADITFGIQVFNDAEVGSEAVVSTLENIAFVVEPSFVALDNEEASTKVAPKGGQVQGFSYTGALGDSLHWEFTGVGAKIDFYDADGNSITPEAKTIDDKDVLVMKMPTATVYVLVYGAMEDGDITVKVAQPIELAVIDATRKYGEENPTFTYSTTGATVKGEVAFATEATATSKVGEYAVSIEGSGITNSYVTLKSGTLTITKAPLTITAKSYTIKQGEALPTLEMEYAGFKNEENASVLTAQPTIATEATSTSELGEYAITVSGAEAENYELAYVNGKLIITNADPVTITAKSYEIEYGEALPAFEFISEGADLDGKPSITCDVPTGAPAGTYTIVISKGGVTNYNDMYVNGTLTIKKAMVTITADDIEVHQDEAMPMLTWKAEGWKNEEDESVLIAQPVCTTEGSPSSSEGEYVISVSGAEAANYEFTYVPGKLTVLVPTGIAEIDMNVAPSDIYTLQGIKVRSKAESMDGLAEGFYIVNGRKVFIRKR